MPNATKHWLTRPRFSAALVIGLMVIAALACKSYEWVEYVNGTDEVIMISYRDRPYLRSIFEPGDSVQIGTPIGTGVAFTVYDNTNVRLADFDFSWEELQAADFNVTIRADQLTVGE